MVKKRIFLLVGLLVLSLAGQVLLRPCLGTPQRANDISSASADEPALSDVSPPPAETSQSPPAFADDPELLQGQLWRQFFYMIGFVALIGVGAWLVCRKVSGGAVSGGRVIRIGETVRLGPRKTLHLVRIGPKTLLVAAAGESLSLLADVSKEVAVLETVEDNSDG